MKPVSLLCTKFTSGNFIIRCRAVHAVAMLYQGGMDLGVDDVSLVEFAIKECKKYVNEELGQHPSAPMVVDCFLLLIQSLLQYFPHPPHRSIRCVTFPSAGILETICHIAKSSYKIPLTVQNQFAVSMYASIRCRKAAVGSRSLTEL